MTQLSITIRSDFSEAEDQALRLGSMDQVMRVTGEIIRGEVLKNFRQGGVFPSKWLVSKRVKKHGGQTLVRTAILRNSISVESNAESATVGTSVSYAAIHQFGGTIVQQVQARTNVHGENGKFVARKTLARRKTGIWRISLSPEHTRTIVMPARPFLPIDDQGNLSPEVGRRLENTLAKWIMKGVV